MSTRNTRNGGPLKRDRAFSHVIDLSLVVTIGLKLGGFRHLSANSFLHVVDLFYGLDNEALMGFMPLSTLTKF